MSFVSKTLLAAAVAVGFTASAATAATIDFEESTGGTVSYDGSTTLEGNGIGFGTVTIGADS